MSRTKKVRKTCFELRAALDGMHEFGLTQKRLAEMCGVHSNQVSRWCQGTTEVPQYVWTILSMLSMEPLEVVWGEIATWEVERRHVFKNGKEYKTLAKRFHPDATGRDTTAEMQIINDLRK